VQTGRQRRAFDEPGRLAARSAGGSCPPCHLGVSPRGVWGDSYRCAASADSPTVPLISCHIRLDRPSAGPGEIGAREMLRWTRTCSERPAHVTGVPVASSCRRLKSTAGLFTAHARNASHALSLHRLKGSEVLRPHQASGNPISRSAEQSPSTRRAAIGGESAGWGSPEVTRLRQWEKAPSPLPVMRSWSCGVMAQGSPSLRSSSSQRKIRRPMVAGFW